MSGTKNVLNKMALLAMILNESLGNYNKAFNMVLKYVMNSFVKVLELTVLSL